MKSIIYKLYGDVRSLSRMRITKRRLHSHVQEQGIILSIELERQHAGRGFFNGPLHIDMDVFFVPKVTSWSKYRSTPAHIYNNEHPTISVLVGFLEQIGQGILFNNGTSICSLNCAKRFTGEAEPYITFAVKELKNTHEKKEIQ